jgi:anthranilate synthase component 2
MKILLLDNYDSFTYNLLHILKELGADVDVKRNDKITIPEVEAYDKIVLSPGPGIPSEAGIMLDLIKTYGATKSILGVCLGEQGIGEAYGAKLENLSEVHHGISSIVKITAKDPLFDGLDDEIEVGRYHSWVVSKEDFPSSLEITAEDGKGEIMAIRHKEYDVRGIQFHPESILTPKGKTILSNWLKI